MPDESRRKILWADDEIDLLRPHIKFLEQRGFAVTAVPNGEDALAALGRDRYDVVLLDEMMPGLGGLATLDAIQSRELAVPVILVTKSEEERLMEEHYAAWVHDAQDRPLLSHEVVRRAVVPQLAAGRRVVFVVVDCMRIDQWLTLEPLLEELFEVERAYYCSILPTATPYARNAIFSGLLPDDLERSHPDLWQESGNDERSKNRH